MSMAGEKPAKNKKPGISYKIYVHRVERILLTSMNVGLYSYKKNKSGLRPVWNNGMLAYWRNGSWLPARLGKLYNSGDIRNFNG